MSDLKDIIELCLAVNTLADEIHAHPTPNAKHVLDIARRYGDWQPPEEREAIRRAESERAIREVWP